MSFFTAIENAFVTTEQHVLTWIGDIKTDAPIAVKDIKNALSWVASQAPKVATALADLETLITTVEAATPGFTQNATVTRAIADANASVAALNAFANAANTGSNDATAVVKGYVALQTALGAASSAKAAVSATPT